MSQPKGAPLTDLAGLTFGFWQVAGRDTDAPKRQVRWRCVCRCGNRRSVFGHTLREGRSTSCGCGRKAAMAKLRAEKGADWKVQAAAQAAQRAEAPGEKEGAFAKRMKARIF